MLGRAGSNVAPEATNLRRTIMNRFLLAIGLIAAFSTPALASLGKEPTSYGQRHVERISTHQRM
jgi:hypothetical protein